MLTISFAMFLVVIAGFYSALLWWLNRGLRHPYNGQNSRRLSVSVVVAARNEAEHIGRTLDTILNQTYDNFRIIVVDDRSTDETGAIVQRYQQRTDKVELLRIDTVPADFAPKKYAIHTAIEHSDAELIVTTDADCRPEPMWLECMVRQFDPDVGMVIGLIHYLPRAETFLQRWQSFDFFALMCAAAATTQLGYPFAGAGPSLAYRRELYFRIGGFGSLRHRISGDDVLLIQLFRRYTTAKIRFLTEPVAAVVTDTETRWGQFYRQRQRWASNSSIQWRLNRAFFGFLVFVFILNLAVLLTPIAFVWHLELIIPWSFLLAIKALTEFRLLKTGSRLFERPELIGFFPFWFLTYPLYVLVMGVAGNVDRIRWK